MKLDGKNIQGTIKLDLENASGVFNVYHNANGDPWSCWSMVLTDSEGNEVLKVKNLPERTLASICDSYEKLCNIVHR